MPPTSALQLLLIEDNRSDARYLEELLREATTFVNNVPENRALLDTSRKRIDRQPDLHHEVTLSAGLDRLDDDIDVILLDLILPDSRGIDTVSTVTEHTDKPVVVLTGLQEREIGLEAIREGAEDYLVKDEINSDLLVRAVYHALERRAHERELRQYETLIERSTDVNAIVDADRTIRYVTPSVERVLGYGADRAIGSDVMQFVHEEDREDVNAALAAVIGGEVQAPLEFRVQHADGSWVILEARAQNLIDDPLVEGIVVYTRDVTERVARERKLEQFARVVSHDLRNPLGIAQTYLQEIRRSRDLGDIDRVEKALDRIDSLIDSLLTLAREGQTINEVERVKLGGVISAAWTQVDTKGASLSVGPSLGTVTADPERLQTMFENLFRNAVEHGGADVELSVHRSGRTLIVEDSGPGIPPTDRDEVFEFGYSTGGGTGTGLAIVRAIARAHEWDIEVGESDRGGARFEFHGLVRDVMPELGSGQ